MEGPHDLLGKSFSVSSGKQILKFNILLIVK